MNSKVIAMKWNIPLGGDVSTVLMEVKTIPEDGSDGVMKKVNVPIRKELFSLQPGYSVISVPTEWLQDIE